MQSGAWITRFSAWLGHFFFDTPILEELTLFACDYKSNSSVDPPVSVLCSSKMKSYLWTLLFGVLVITKAQGRCYFYTSSGPDVLVCALQFEALQMAD